MSKKPPVSTGSVSTAKSRAPARPVSRNRRVISHAGKSDRGARLAWYVGGGIVVLVLILFGAGYYNDNIGPARGRAITVGGHDVSLGYYRDRLRATSISQGDGTQTDAYSKESTVTDTIEEQQVYLQRAASLGVTASDNDIAVQIAKDNHATVAGDKLSDPAQYESLLRTELLRSQLSLDQYREVAKAEALKQKVLDKFKADVPKQAPAAKGMELVFQTENQGKAAQQRLENGDTVNDIAQDMTADPSLGSSKPIDWTPVGFGLLPGDIDRFVADHQPGEVSTLLKVDQPSASGTPGAASTAAQYYLVAITDRDANHDVADAQSSQIASKKQTDWFSQQKAALHVHSYVDGDKAIWAAQHTDLPLQKPSPTPPRPLTQPGAPGAPGGAPGAPAGPQQPGAAPGAPQSGPAAPGGAPAAPPAAPRAPSNGPAAPSNGPAAPQPPAPGQSGGNGNP